MCKRSIPVFAIFILLLSLQSCVILSPKKYKGIVAQRDSLAQRTAILEQQVMRLEADTVKMHRQLAELNNNYNTLNTNYNASSSKVDQLAGDLQKREARLKEVEETLRKRDEATNALRNKLQQALLGFQNSGLTVDIRNGKVYVSLADKLLFPSGSIVINENGKTALKQFAAVLN
ncbi:MAG: hypothetical protein EOP42_16090, partial [Sphingobacteriaceae bacterium]